MDKKAMSAELAKLVFEEIGGSCGSLYTVDEIEKIKGQLEEVLGRFLESLDSPEIQTLIEDSLGSLCSDSVEKKGTC